MDIHSPVLPITSALLLEEHVPLVSDRGTAHDAFVSMLPMLLHRLTISEDAEESSTKKVVVRGAFFEPASIGVKFSAEFKDGKLLRVRVMTANGDDDLTQLPAELGGAGLMAAAGAGDVEPPRAAPAKRKRARLEEAPTLEDAITRAMELARIGNRADLVAQLDLLLKTC
jgi:hypothetical protein